MPPDVEPLERARTLFIDGLDHFGAGRFDLAERSFARSLEFMPGRISTQVNLAATLLRLARPAEALALARQILKAEPGNVDALFHAGTAHERLGQYQHALRSFDRALVETPEALPIVLERGVVLQRLQRPLDALAAFEQASTIDPSNAFAASCRGTTLRELGRYPEAAVAFRQAIADGADTELNRFYLASVDKAALPLAAPPGYVEALFDDYAEDFEQHLVDVLGYKAHAVLAATIKAAADSRGRRFERGVDLGCGTGLCGRLIRSCVVHLSGVDLSGQMTVKARASKVYDDVAQGDIVEWLRARHASGEPLDLIVAADVLIYSGDLDAVLAAARLCLRPSSTSLLCFSLEHADPSDADAAARGFVLKQSLRYAHTPKYARDVAARHGFEVVALEAGDIRQDQRESIPGLYVSLRPAVAG